MIRQPFTSAEGSPASSYTPPVAAPGAQSTITEGAQSTTREVVGVFDNLERLRAAMVDLQENGFMRQELGFLAHHETVSSHMGDDYRTLDLKKNPHTPRADIMPDEPIGEAEAALVGIPFYIAAVTTTCIVAASGGTILAAIAAAAAAGAGAAALGGILSGMLARHHADYLQEQLDRGGLLIWVNIKSPEFEARAREILTRHGAHHIDAHDIAI